MHTMGNIFPSVSSLPRHLPRQGILTQDSSSAITGPDNPKTANIKTMMHLMG